MKASFEQGFAALESDLLELDGRLRTLSSASKDTPLLGSHPVYQYLARGYELDIRSVHFEPDELPDHDGWHDLEHLMDERSAEWMLWEGEPLGETVAKLEELGVESVVFDPCGNKPNTGDFLSVMKQNIANLEKVVK
jgi:zinc transport system substrate-binding protein